MSYNRKINVLQEGKKWNAFNGLAGEDRLSVLIKVSSCYRSVLTDFRIDNNFNYLFLGPRRLDSVFFTLDRSLSKWNAFSLTQLIFFFFCLLKYALAKTLRCKLQVLSTFWQLYNGIFSSIAIGRQMSPQTHQNFLFLLIFSSPASPALSPPLFFLVRPLFLRVAAQNEVNSWIRGAC